MRMARELEEDLDTEHWSESALDEALSALHPTEDLLRQDRLPHIWCPGCGIGVTMGALVAAIKEAEIDREKLCVVSGIGCSGRVSGYLDCDTFHTTHGRAIPSRSACTWRGPT